MQCLSLSLPNTVSPNPDCDLNYSKSDYLCTEIFTLPAHFELPPIPVSLSEAEKLEAARECGDETQAENNERETDNVEPMNAADTSTMPQDEHCNGQVDSITNFKNIYINKPPAAVLRDRREMWYNIPWRVAQSFEVSALRMVNYLQADLRRAFSSS
jgi:hypothetical protein